jgi:hypothetical protein
MKRWPALAALLLAATGTAGCGNDDLTSQYGAVSSLNPQLCVGRHAAMGECFTGATPAMLSPLHVGQCVKVTFKISGSMGTGPARLRSVSAVKAEAHRLDCPAAEVDA